MKYTNQRAFEKHLQEASPQHLASVYMILSKEDFARKAATDHLLNVLLKEEKQRNLSVVTFDAQQVDLDAIVAELNARSFFSKRKVVLVSQAEKLIKSEHEKLDAFFSKPTPATTLVFTAPTVASNTNFFKKVEKAGIVLDIAEEKAWEKEKSLQSWAIHFAANAGKKLDPAAAQFLVKQTSDQALLYQELEKLICYVGTKGEITQRDVSLLCSSTHVENIWQLGEALFKRDTATALRISKGMLDEGTAFLALLRQLRSQFQTDYQVSCILARGGTTQEISQQFPYMRDAILSKHIQTAKTYGKEKFKAGLLAIDETELKAKNSAADEDLLNELLITRLT